MAKMHELTATGSVVKLRLRSLQSHSECKSRHFREQAKVYTAYRSADSHASARRPTTDYSYLDQENDRSVPGDLDVAG